MPPVRYGWQKGGSQQACEQDRRPGAATTRPSLAAWLEPDAGRWHATRLPGCLYLYNIPLEQLARAAGRSLSTFRRDFVDLFGSTPSRWLMARRLEEARLLLSSGERPGDILIALGFESFSHFTRSYKLRFGVLPSHKDNRICIL